MLFETCVSELHISCEYRHSLIIRVDCVQYSLGLERELNLSLNCRNPCGVIRSSRKRCGHHARCHWIDIEPFANCCPSCYPDSRSSASFGDPRRERHIYRDPTKVDGTLECDYFPNSSPTSSSSSTRTWRYVEVMLTLACPAASRTSASVRLPARACEMKVCRPW